MKCPRCGLQNGDSAVMCRRCGEPLTPSAQAEGTAKKKITLPSRLIIMILCWIVFIPIALVGIYKAYFWIEAWREAKAYAEMTLYAQVEEISMEFNKPGHAITIFGTDGDIISIEELHESFVVLGGLVRIEVEDSFWFDLNPEDVDSAVIQLTPTAYREDGSVVEMPIIELEVKTPYTPVTLITPSNQTETVYSSVYEISMQVVPGTMVLINGEDISKEVDREGKVAVNVNVLPQGDNRISVYASTDHHKDTRMDIILYRPVMEINLELSANTKYSSTRSLLAIKGKIDPTATLVVDTAHESGSIKVDSDGDFEFKAKFSTVGYNTVRFRAVKEGYADSIISFRVYYVPSLAEYSSRAWLMDYTQLRSLYTQWQGRVFQCIGTIYDVFTSGDDQYVVMNVGNSEDVKLVVLLNMSGTASFDREIQYKAYADVNGDYYYEANNYPLLICRYMDVYVPK